jgi:hypothetical protein
MEKAPIMALLVYGPFKLCPGRQAHVINGPILSLSGASRHSYRWRKRVKGLSHGIVIRCNKAEKYTWMKWSARNRHCFIHVQIKLHWKTFHPFPPLHFLPEFVPQTECKGRPEDTKWNVLYHTALRNYAAISLHVPSILSILLDAPSIKCCTLVYSIHRVIA